MKNIFGPTISGKGPLGAWPTEEKKGKAIPVLKKEKIGKEGFFIPPMEAERLTDREFNRMSREQKSAWGEKQVEAFFDREKAIKSEIEKNVTEKYLNLEEILGSMGLANVEDYHKMDILPHAYMDRLYIWQGLISFDYPKTKSKITLSGKVAFTKTGKIARVNIHTASVVPFDGGPTLDLDSKKNNIHAFFKTFGKQSGLELYELFRRVLEPAIKHYVQSEELEDKGKRKRATI